MNDKLISNQLALSEDDQWKRLRCMVSPAFSIANIRRMKPFIDDICQTLIRNFDKKRFIKNFKFLKGLSKRT